MSESQFNKLIKDGTLTTYQALLLISMAKISDRLDAILMKMPDTKPQTANDDKHPVTNFEMYLQTK